MDLVKFTEGILHGKLSFLCSETSFCGFKQQFTLQELQLNDTYLNDADTTEAISEERNALTIEETVVGTPAQMLNDEIISTLEKKFETFQSQQKVGFLILKTRLSVQRIAVLRKQVMIILIMLFA